MIFINMKKKFTSKQLQEIESKLLNEQYTPFPAYGTAGGTIEYAKTARELDHDVATVMSIVTAFVPVIGPYLSAGFMAMDAYQYHKEGNDQMAGLLAIFAAIPFFGSTLRLAAAPILARMAPASKKILARKIIAYQAGKKVTFTKAEQIVLKDIAGNPKLIQQQMRREAAKAAAKRRLSTQLALGGGKFGLEVGKYMAITEAWGALYAEMGIDVTKLQASLRPMLENIKRAVEMQTKAPMQQLATPGMNTGVFSRLPKLEQIIREEYHTIKEKIGDATPKPKDYSNVKVPFKSTEDLQSFRDHFKNRAAALGDDVKKDYDRLKSKMTGSSETLADKEFYSLHKSLVDRWWKSKQQQEEKEEGDDPWIGWLIDSSLWISIFKNILEFLTSAAGAASTLITTILGYKLLKGGGAQGAASLTVKDAQAIGIFYRILPRLTRGQIRKILSELGIKKSFTDAEINALKNKLRQQGRGLTRNEVYKTIIEERATSIALFVRNPTSKERIASLHSVLTSAEIEQYSKYINQYIQLTDKYGNASWATKWFR